MFNFSNPRWSILVSALHNKYMLIVTLVALQVSAGVYLRLNQDEEIMSYILMMSILSYCYVVFMGYVIGVIAGFVGYSGRKVQTGTSNCVRNSKLVDGDLMAATKRMATLVARVDYRNVDVPIGVRFESRSADICTVHWSMKGRVERVAADEVTDYLNTELDRLELEQAIQIDEDAGYTAP